MAIFNRKSEPTPAASARPPEGGLEGIKNIVAVGSGKGGVGKSTVAVNLAVAMAKTGARVGLMDADIYGPSQPGMLGAGGRKPEMVGEVLAPLHAHGVSFISIGSLIPDDGPVVWRAPMAMKMIHNFLGGVVWGELDYLFIDLPPGTGDVQLTLAQQASLSGAVIVTTPQDVALGIAAKGLRMFQSVNVPILGIIENMSGFHCAKCGEQNNIFKTGGGARLAENLKVPFLGAVPLDTAIVASGDTGTPVAAASPDSPSGQAFFALARALHDSLSQIAASAPEPADVKMTPDGNILVTWSDNHAGLHTPRALRLACTCASCVSEDTGKPLLNPARVPGDIKAKAFGRVGRYGVSFLFSDTHNTGIYIHEHLRALCECPACQKARGPAVS